MAIKATVRNPKKKKRRTAAQKAATKKLVALNKKRRRKKNPTRKKVVRRKVTRSVKRRKPIRRRIKPMAARKRKRRTYSRKRSTPIRRRRRTKRNPSGDFMGLMISGLMTAGATIAGLYAGTGIANMAAGSTGDMTKKAQYRNLSRLALTLGAAFLLPKYPKMKPYSEAIVGGLMTSLAMGAMKSVFGLDVGTLSGDSLDYDSSYLLGAGSGGAFNVSDDFNIAGISDVGLSFEEENTLSGISEL